MQQHAQRRESGGIQDTARRFDRREAPRGDRLSGRGSINHGFPARGEGGEDYYGIRAIR